MENVKPTATARQLKAAMSILLRYKRVSSDVGTILLGSTAARVLDFLFGALIARTLGPKAFGTFAVLSTFTTTTATVSRVGLNNSFLKIISDYRREKLIDDENILTNAFFIFRMAPVVLLVLVGLAASSLLLRILSLPHEQLPLIRFAFIGVLGISLFEFVYTRYQADEQFARYAIIQNFQSGAKIAILGVLLYFAVNLNLSIAFMIWAGIAVLAALIGLADQDKGFVHHFAGLKTHFLRMFSFSKWIALSAYCTLLFRGMDILFLSHYSSSNRQLGLYAAALNIANVLFFLANTLNIVFIPYVCKLSDRQVWSVFKRGLFLAAPLFATTACVLWLLSGYILALVYGRAYAAGEHMLSYLLIAFTCGAFLSPFTTLAYRIDSPAILFFIDGIRGISAMICFCFLIPHLEATGAALSLLISYGFSSIVGLFLIYRKVRPFSYACVG